MLVFYAQLCGPEAHYQNTTPKVLKSYAFALPHFLHQPEISFSNYMFGTGMNSQSLRPAHALSLFTCWYLSPIIADHVHIFDLSSAIFASETRSTLIGGQGGILRHVHKIWYSTESFSEHKLAEENSAGW